MANVIPVLGTCLQATLQFIGLSFKQNSFTGQQYCNEIKLKIVCHTGNSPMLLLNLSTATHVIANEEGVSTHCWLPIAQHAPSGIEDG